MVNKYLNKTTVITLKLSFPKNGLKEIVQYSFLSHLAGASESPLRHVVLDIDKAGLSVSGRVMPHPCPDVPVYPVFSADYPLAVKYIFM